MVKQSAIDPISTAAIAVEAGRGTYALLIGSGVSRSAAIPTGWEVVQDLIRKVAAASGDDAGPDPVSWFKTKTGKDPSYSTLLDKLAKKPAERQALLRGYFEPTEEERGQGIKTPSPAHLAIAQLVADGHLRVIITTNFDRLLESALSAAGVEPAVISNADQAAGALPLAHVRCVVIKVHGDYLDSRIRNTEAELAAYEPAMNALLDQVFDEYGLIVSGWSGESDTALRAALERSKSRRFSTFWIARHGLTPPASDLAKHRSAIVMWTSSADDFFVSLADRVRAVADLRVPDIGATKVVVAIVKRYAVSEADRVRMRDTVRDLLDVAMPGIDEVRAAEWPTRTVADAVPFVRQYDALTEQLAYAYATGTYWGVSAHQETWRFGIERLSEISEDGIEADLRRYPALRLLYAGGLGALVGDRYDTFAALARTPIQTRTQGVLPAAYLLLVSSQALSKKLATPVMADATGKGQQWYVPASEHLHSVSLPPIQELLGSAATYDDLFDRLEILLALTASDAGSKLGHGGWAPPGRFVYRGRRFGQSVFDQVVREANSMGENWPPLRGGLFATSADVVGAIESASEMVRDIRWSV